MYKDLNKFSKFIDIEENILVEAYEIEKKFHEQIENEKSIEKRKELYKEVYSKVHPLYGKNKNFNFEINIAAKKKVAYLFKNELINKSVLDIGCGDGAFLYAIDKMFIHKKLTGIDISVVTPTNKTKSIDFINSDIICFDTPNKYSTVILDNVYEHISLYDKDILFESIEKNIEADGTLIMLVPCRLFGPWDVSRIVDFSYSGNINSTGTHLNETTYTDLIHELSKRGYNSIVSPLPFRKLKYLSFWLRFPSKWISKIEQSKRIIKFMQNFKIRGQSFFRFEVIVIAKKISHVSKK